jgi:hypothetical protein
MAASKGKLRNNYLHEDGGRREDPGSHCAPSCLRAGRGGAYYADHRRVLNGTAAPPCDRVRLARPAPSLRAIVHGRFAPAPVDTRGAVGRASSPRSRAELAEAGRIDWELWCIDGSHVRAHRVAAGAGGNRQNSDDDIPARHCPGYLPSRARRRPDSERRPELHAS